MKLPRHLLLSVALATLTVCPASAQATLDSVFVYRGAESTQTGANPYWVEDIVTPANSYWVNLTNNSLEWGITVKGTGLSAPTLTTMPTYTNANPAHPMIGENNSTLNPTQHNGGVLGLSGIGNTTEWRYGSPNFDNISWPSTPIENALDRNYRFPLGNYTVSIPDFTDVTLNYQHSTVDLLAPLFTLTGGTWSGGVYYIDPTQTLTITGSAHNGFLTNNVNGAIWHDILDENGDVVPLTEGLRFRTDVTPGNDFISFSVAADTFTAGMDYTLYGGHIYIMDQNAVNGSMNLAFFEATTSLTISAIPEPSTYAMFAGLGALGIVIWRRRQKTA